MAATAYATRPAWAEQVAASRRKVTTTLRAVPPLAAQKRRPRRQMLDAKDLRLRRPIIVTAMLGAIVITQLLFSIATSADAYRLHDLQAQQISMQRQLQAVSGDLERVESPTHLASDAVALGMVPSGNPVFIHLADGSIQGAPQAATGEHVPGNLVPNSQLNGMPLITATLAAQQQAAATAAAKAAAQHPGH